MEHLIHSSINAQIIFCRETSIKNIQLSINIDMVFKDTVRNRALIN